MRCRSGRGEVGVIFKNGFSSGRVGEERKRRQAGQAAEASKREGGAGARCTRRPQQGAEGSCFCRCERDCGAASPSPSLPLRL